MYSDRGMCLQHSSLIGKARRGGLTQLHVQLHGDLIGGGGDDVLEVL